MDLKDGPRSVRTETRSENRSGKSSRTAWHGSDGSRREYRLRRGGEARGELRDDHAASGTACPRRNETFVRGVPLVPRVFLVGLILLGFSLRGLILLLHFNIDFRSRAYSDAAGKRIQMEGPFPRTRDDARISRRRAHCTRQASSTSSYIKLLV